MHRWLQVFLAVAMLEAELQTGSMYFEPPNKALLVAVLQIEDMKVDANHVDRTMLLSPLVMACTSTAAIHQAF